MKFFETFLFQLRNGNITVLMNCSNLIFIIDQTICLTLMHMQKSLISLSQLGITNALANFLAIDHSYKIIEERKAQKFEN